MGWLVSQVIASMAGAFLLVKIFDVLIGGVIGGAATAAKTSLFVSAWTAITTGLGMRRFNKTVRALRHGSKEVRERIDPLPKDLRLK